MSDFDKNGWYSKATRRDALNTRVGGPILPLGVVVHTTDMLPGTHDNLIKAWTTRTGAGNAAHFLIGKTESEGITQFVSVYENSNHAGGKTHGYYKAPSGKLLHPNRYTVGIEIDNAGKLRKTPSGWRYYSYETKRNIGPTFKDDQVDEKGYELPTAFQLLALHSLIEALRLEVLKSSEFENYTVVPHGNYIGAFQQTQDPRLVGHCTLDPADKTDPGYTIMNFLKTFTWHKR